MMRKRKGNALLLALWTIAVLSVMVMSFVYEARQQSGVNIYVRERNRANRLAEGAQAIAEVVLLNFMQAPDWSEDQDTAKLLEDDRWIVEKQELKRTSACTIGPILLDEDDTESGTVTIRIEPVNSGDSGIININELWSGGDSKYIERWWMIFQSHNIPEELSTPKDGTINLWNILIASWNDWRDEDDSVTEIDGEQCGAESKWYEDYEDENQIDDEDKFRPRNNAIQEVRELGKLRGWREYPQVLTGGVINPWDRDEDHITVRGLEHLFTTIGGSKININSINSVDALVTIPGVYENADDDSKGLAEAQVVAQAILEAKHIMPENRSVDETLGTWEFTDWDDLVNRLDDLNEEIGTDASQYFSYKPDETTIFNVTLTGESMGMQRTIKAECYVKDSNVRYISWQED